MRSPQHLSTQCYNAIRLTALGLAITGFGWGAPAHSQNPPSPPAAFSFDREVQGFQAITVGGAGLQPDEKSTLAVSKDTTKGGPGALSYSYRAEPNATRALLGEVRLPPDTRSLQFWARSNTATSFLLSLREEDGSAYGAQFFVPEQTWVPIHLNLDELTLSGDSEDENSQLDAAQIRHLVLLDFSVLVAHLFGGKPPLIVDTQRSRQLWIDEVQFVPTPAPTAGGLAQREGRSYFVVDTFENGIIRWLPLRVLLNPAEPRFEPFPLRGTLAIYPPAPPENAERKADEPRTLRFAYARSGMDAWALQRNLEGLDLQQTTGVHLRVRTETPSTLMLTLKEQDGSEYQYPITLKAQEWQTVEIPFTALQLGENSQDQNQQLDPAQLKELAVLDISSMTGMAGGPTFVELGEIRFLLR